MKRLKLAFGLFWFALTKGHTLQLGLLNCVSQIFEFFIQANTSDRPMYTKLLITTDDDTYLNLWCSKGITPSERAIELAKENQMLKAEIESLKEGTCKCDSRIGETKLWCCNQCGKRTEEF